MKKLSKKQQFFKRVFDLVISILIIPILIVPIIILVIIAAITTKQSGIFIQKRIGKNGIPFSVYKIRTLKENNHKDITEIKHCETSFGKWLRKSKLDELPQLFNVLFGSMSLVGPRPDLPGYADKLIGEDRIILSVKPGITGPATIKYKNEDKLLLQQEDPNYYNDEVIWPDKVAINKNYIASWTFFNDVKYLLKSFLS